MDADDQDDRPDLVVAIDLGMTYTGVGWARPQSGGSQTPIQIVHNWPGSLSLGEQKVKTRLAYAPTGHLSSWGYLCDEDGTADALHREFFKIFLDQETVDRAQREGLAGAPASVAEAQRLIEDYLRQVYQHVRSTLAVQIGEEQWEALAIEFLFSVPTTWRTHDIINRFKQAIRAAGFGVDGRRHRATVELTEAEAAAVATIKAAAVRFAQNDVFIVVDAGGGTTDCSVMQVADASGRFPQLAQVAAVDGVGIGAALIDVAFAAAVRQRLAPHPDLQAALPPGLIETLLRSEAFARMKHRFGEPARSTDDDVYTLPLDGVGFGFDHPAAGIRAGKLLFARAAVQALFDTHIDQVLAKIREQLDWSADHLAGHSVSCMVLSGGLGSSRYVRDRLARALQTDPHPAAPAIQILQAPDPQLVVVRGLLLDRLQRLDAGSGRRPVLVQRRARASYGVVTERLFDPALHAGATVKKDPYDGRLYAVELISWIIRQGDPVDPLRPVGRRYFRYLDHPLEHHHAGPRPAWDSIIVQSHCPRDALPAFLHADGVRPLCKVTSNLDGIRPAELKLRRRPSASLFRRGEKYYVCQYDVCAVVAPADLRFELYFRGKKFSRNHEPIKVEWDDAQPDSSL